MSTEIGKLKKVMNEETVSITRFYGGEENGVCVQLTDSKNNFLQFNVSDLITLIPLLETYIIEYSQEVRFPNMNFEFEDGMGNKSTDMFTKIKNKLTRGNRK
jgi:hypothetical protein